MSHYPGYPAATDKINVLLQLTDHPNHHNLLGTAVNWLDAAVGTLQATVDAIPSLANVVSSDGSFHHIVMLTAAAYAAIVTPDTDTWYVIVG